jgi:hypothetical protein
VKEGANPDVDEIRKFVSGRLKKAVADGPHPDPNLLAAFTENALPDAARTQLLQHLGGCADCREILYLAMPDSAVAQKALSLRPNRLSVFAWRWGAAAASVAIIAVLFVTGRHKMAAPGGEHWAVVAPAAPAPAQIVADKAPPEFDQLRAAQDEGRSETRPARKAVPEPKHMTAKPKTELEFDSSDQVRMVPPAAQNVLKDEDAGFKGKVVSNSPVATGRRAAEQTAQDLKRDDRKLTEAVEVSAGAVSVSEDKQTGTEIQSQNAAALPRAPQSSGYQAKALSLAPLQWRLSERGAVQRSVDSGRTWRNIIIAGQSVFRVVSAMGAEVWAGGRAGVLYHSADSGANWAQIEPAASGRKLTADITHIQFADALNGTVSTSNGEVWATTDGGRNWQRK